MSRQIDQNFDQVVPAAADRGRQFLGVLQKRCQSEGIGIELVATRPDRKKDRVILVADVPVRGRPRRLEVFADPMGNALHVGWQTTVELASGLIANTRFVRELQAGIDRVDTSSENVRALSGILQAFHAVVFMPVLQQLADAVERSRATQNQGGFFGA